MKIKILTDPFNWSVRNFFIGRYLKKRSADNLGGILEAALSLNGIVGGATFAIFALGILAPFVESIGATVGLLTGVSVCTWMYIGRNVLPLPTEILQKTNPLPVSIDSCIYPNGSSPIVRLKI